MEDPSGNVMAQPPSRQPSRYRSTREGTRAGPDMGCGPTTNYTTMAYQTKSGDESQETNPSIARSMSRYRRNRPSANAGNNLGGKTSSVSDRARAHPVPVPPLPGNAKPTANTTAIEEEERRKALHRLDAMEQLTGAPPEAAPPKNSSRRFARAQQTSSDSTKTSSHKDAKQMQPSEPAAKHRPSSNPSVSTTERKSFLQKVKLSRSKDSTETEQQVPRYIGVGGGGIVPGTDAPVSAVNAGERHVLVQYSDASLSMPITPSTSVADLLLSASQQLSSDIDPAKFILLESFNQVGLQRPLRRYEHVREVMNSWVHDDDNRLIIVPPSGIEALEQVDGQKVPSEKPAEVTVYLYHSSRPRKWDKRYVTLRSDGQILVSKKENSKDHTNICHLSDYDIYSPSARAVAKEVKPPKKMCLAIKSQQKSSIFLSTENFVHFFCTNDRAVGDKWHRAVQQWRSWYLVNTLGAIQSAEGQSPHRSRTMKSTRQISVESPLLDRIPSDSEPLARMRPSMDHSNQPESRAFFARKRYTREREHTHPPTKPFPETLSLNTHLPEIHDNNPLAQGMSPEEIDDETFSPTGLLGRTYTQRHAAMRERQEQEKRANQDSQANSPSTAPNTNTLLSRAKSIKQSGKPLVDLTPVFQEPPQHTRKGRGVTVEAGMPLIDAATGPELAPTCMAIPPSTAWRRPSITAADVPPIPQRTRANTIRSIRQPPQPNPVPTTANSNTPAVPFLPNSLLANTKTIPAQAQGQAPVGHGVATGDRNATRPMLDMSPQNPFAEGSLLHKLE